MVDPDEVRSLGQALQVRGSAAQDVSTRVLGAVHAATWQGAAAARLTLLVETVARQVAMHANDLTDLGVQVSRLGDALDTELTELRSIEDQVRAWFAANPLVPPPWPPTALPPSGDPVWRQVEAAFAARGIVLAAGAAPAASSFAPSTAGGDWRSTLSPDEAWIIQHESNFNPDAVNPSSGAFGIWQGLGSTLDGYAKRFGFDPHTTDPNQQLVMFRAYVKDRYGNAANAKAFWEAHHWY